MDPGYKEMSVKKQCKLLEINRSSYYYKQREEKDAQDVEDLKLVLDVLRKIPFYGYRKISKSLQEKHPRMTRKRVRRIMNRFGLRALYAKPYTSQSRKEHKKYPYLLKGKEIRYPNQVWGSDITYIRLPGGFVYLVAILDLYSRKVLNWKISNSLDASFCVEALEEAICRNGEPAIFNTDQGCQFTSDAFIEVLKKHHIEISMDGKGRAFDNIYVERLWRTLKYEDIYLKYYESMNELKGGLTLYFNFYNNERFHQSLEYRTPEEMYESFSNNELLENVA